MPVLWFKSASLSPATSVQVTGSRQGRGIIHWPYISISGIQGCSLSDSPLVCVASLWKWFFCPSYLPYPEVLFVTSFRWQVNGNPLSLGGLAFALVFSGVLFHSLALERILGCNSRDWFNYTRSFKIAVVSLIDRFWMSSRLKVVEGSCQHLHYFYVCIFVLVDSKVFGNTFSPCVFLPLVLLWLFLL